jgi:hypothetical protein
MEHFEVCLVTPNWTFQLPGGSYEGTDPDGYMPKDEIVAFLETYAARSGAPVREGIAVRSLESAPAGGFLAQTSTGALQPGSGRSSSRVASVPTIAHGCPGRTRSMTSAFQFTVRA